MTLRDIRWVCTGMLVGLVIGGALLSGAPPGAHHILIFLSLACVVMALTGVINARELGARPPPAPGKTR